jgi:hypothetical protein
VKILLDHCVPKRLRREITGHAVTRAIEMGWERLQNGALLDAAEDADFEVLLTVDRNIPHQQRMRGRRIALVIMISATSNKMESLLPLVRHVLSLLPTVLGGQVYEVTIAGNEVPQGDPPPT